MHRQCTLWGSQASVPHGEQSHPAESHPGKSPQLLPSPRKPLLSSYSTCTFFLPQTKPPDAYFSPPPCFIQVQTTQLAVHCPTVPNFAAAQAQPPEEPFGEPCQSPPGNPHPQERLESPNNPWPGQGVPNRELRGPGQVHIIHAGLGPGHSLLGGGTPRPCPLCLRVQLPGNRALP